METMRQKLRAIRAPKPVPVKRAALHTALILIAGIALGFFSKWLDGLALDSGIGWHRLIEAADLGNFFSDIAFWMLAALVIAVFSASALRAGLNVFVFFAGMISYKMLPHDTSKRYFSKNGKGGISCKLGGAIEMALLFVLFESFLAATSNHSFIWVYKWWGVLPVFITTYVPFFLASNYVPDMEPKKRKIFLISLWSLVALLLIILIPLGII